MNRLLTIHEIAEYMNCSTKTVKRRVDRGIIPAIQPAGKGTQLSFDLDDVVNALKQNPSDSKPAADSKKSQDKLSGPTPKWMRN